MIQPVGRDGARAAGRPLQVVCTTFNRGDFATEARNRVRHFSAAGILIHAVGGPEVFCTSDVRSYDGRLLNCRTLVVVALQALSGSVTGRRS